MRSQTKVACILNIDNPETKKNIIASKFYYTFKYLFTHNSLTTQYSTIQYILTTNATKFPLLKQLKKKKDTK